MEGTLLASSKRCYFFQYSIVIFQFPPCNKTKRSFKCWNLYYFSDYLELLLLSVVLLLIFFFLFVQNFFFTLCWKNHPDLGNFLSVSLIFSPLGISIFHFFTCQEDCCFLSPDSLTNIFINHFYVTVISNTRNILFYIVLCRTWNLYVYWKLKMLGKITALSTDGSIRY